MAEGFLRDLSDNQVEVLSAGLHPSHVHPKAIEVMKEIGIDISAQRSKSIEEYIHSRFDWVITVCDHAQESCPVFPAPVKRLHFSFTDPAQAKGTDSEILEVFRQIRDQIQTQIQNFLDTIRKESYEI